MKRVLKVVLYLLGAAAGLAVLFVVWASVSFRPDFVGRLLRWGNSDVYDYQRFPARGLAAVEEPYSFPVGDMAQEIRAVFEAHPLVDDLDTFLEDTGTQAFLVVYRGELVLEAYYNGTQRDSIVTSFSMAKSYASTLIGIAIEEGYIHSVNDPITDYLPELAERAPASNTKSCPPPAWTTPPPTTTPTCAGWPSMRPTSSTRRANTCCITTSTR